MKMQPRQVIYVSCDPATLARDIRVMLQAGCTLVQSRPLDMFPQTGHIESISLLVKRERMNSAKIRQKQPGDCTCKGVQFQGSNLEQIVQLDRLSIKSASHYNIYGFEKIRRRSK